MRQRSLTRALNRSARRVWYPRWRRRALFLVGGFSVGGAAVALALLADRAQMVFHLVQSRWPLSPLVLAPLGFGLAAWLTRRVFPGAQGSGIPQVMAARQLAGTAAREKLVSIRIAIGKMLLLLLALACGASSGREGPTVQIGAAIMFALGRLSPRRQPGLLLAGSAAGIAAAFNAPLAGIIFGIEEMGRSFETRTSGLVLGTVIAAGLTSLATLGDYTYFGTTSAIFPIGPQWIAVLAAGIAGGFAGGAFSRILIAFTEGLHGVAGAWLKANPVPFAVLCGLALASCGVATGGTIFGTGYEQAQMILHGQAGLSAWFGPMKLLATALSSISGIPGGIFSPSLAVGAGIGQDIALVWHGVPVGVLAILSMAAYLTGVVQAPITSFVIVSEMTENHALIIPIMLACMIANTCSKLICEEGVYQSLSRRFIPPGAELRGSGISAGLASKDSG